MNAGKLRHRLQLQAPIESADSVGGQNLSLDENWNTYATVWGMVEPLGGREFMNADQVVQEGTHRITIRGRQPIQANHRIVYKARKFGITNPSDLEERGITLVLMVKEIAP